MLNVGNSACGSSRSPGRTRRGLKHVHSPRIQRKQLADVTIDNARIALPENFGGRVPIQHTTFTNTYHVEAELGRGKFAVVKKCRHKESNKDYAAKILRKRRGGRDCRSDIMHEVKMLEMAMDHPRLVQLIALFETQHELMLVMEHAAGGELFKYVMMEEGFEETEVIRLMKQVLEALIFLHQRNIVHMDIKPQNILLTAAPPTGDVKLCDFGFSRTITSQDDVRDIIGTPDYVAPEILSYEPLHTPCDMWSVGVLVYVMLTGCSPFAGDNKMETFSNITQLNLEFPSDLFDGISKQAIQFIGQVLVRDPEERLTAEQCLNHTWFCENPITSSDVIDSSLDVTSDGPVVASNSSLVMSQISSFVTPNTIDDDSLVTPSVIDSSLVTPHMINSAYTVIDSSITSVIDSALTTPSVIDSPVAPPNSPPISSPPSSRSSVYMSADSLLEINDKRSSRCLDSSGDELDRSTDNLDQSTDNLNQSTDSLDQSTDSLNQRDILNAIQIVNLDNDVNSNLQDCDHLTIDATYDATPCDSNIANSIGCDGHVTKYGCDNVTVTRSNYFTHQISSDLQGIESQNTPSLEFRNREHMTCGIVGNNQSTVTGYHRAKLAQLSLDSIHDIPCICIQEATYSVHHVQHSNGINGNDLISQRDVTKDEHCEANYVRNRCYGEKRLANGLGNISHQSDSTNEKTERVSKRFVYQHGNTGCLSEEFEIQSDNFTSDKERSKCLNNLDDMVTNLDVILTSSDVYVTDNDSYVTNIDMTVTETDIYTPVLLDSCPSGSNDTTDFSTDRSASSELGQANCAHQSGETKLTSDSAKIERSLLDRLLNSDKCSVV